ncbi:MAG: peptidoglycan DD-metalloendopeptidase family protein [Bacteroidetes bacterium]|nr:peptidoglycan DD-metalloendopeptidase family protein [Bacteroidota bacterium]
MQGPFKRLFTTLFCFPLIVFAGEKKSSAPVDTSVRTINVEQIAAGDSVRSFIRSMNQQQLYSLVDFLFEMDSIPVELVDEINSVVKKHKCELVAAVEKQNDWDEKHIFSVKELTERLDTTCVISLIDEQHMGYSLPIVGVITSKFGWRKTANHNGVDIDLNKGDKVVAAFDGVVRFARFQGGFGNVVIVRHANGLETLYAHLTKIKVKPGQVVNSGDLLGLGGSTGHSTGTHLHFEIRFKSKPINPMYLFEFAEQKLVSERLIIKSTRLGLSAYPPDIKEYIAKKGDTVFDVAKHFGVSAKALALQNKISQWSRLKAGQKIVIG